MEKELSKQLLDYLISFLESNENEDFDECFARQARAIFTTLCLYEGVDVDTMTYGRLLEKLYNTGNTSEHISYEGFDAFMCELLV